MADDKDPLLDAITDVVPKLLGTLEIFEQLQERVPQGEYQTFAELLAPNASELANAALEFSAVAVPEDLAELCGYISESCTYALRGAENISKHAEGFGMVMRAMRAMRKAQSSIYPLSPFMSPVSQFFLEPAARSNTNLIKALGEGARREQVGLHHASNSLDERGGFSLYVPENLDLDRPASLVIALHGGTGHGADFLWSWLREARTRGFIVLAPTSQQDTWSLMGEEHDLPALLSVLDLVRSHWLIDESHILLTGMSDGGTYSLLAGLRPDSPFTHLAPFSGVLHPEIVMSGNLRFASGRDIYLVHGTRDWMFPIESAYMARAELEQAGANLKFREIEGLSHTYARSENPALIHWFNNKLAIPS